MRLKTSIGGNLIRTTSSTSAGFECKLNFVYIFCNLFTFHFFFTPVLNGARHFLAYRLDSTRLFLPLSIFSMANSSTKFLPLASLGALG